MSGDERTDREGSTRRQYLTFSLGGQVFALETGHVSEVIDLPVVTRVPRAPDFLPGIVNLRGNAATVVDLARKLGLEGHERNGVRCAIVIEREFEGERLALAALADTVHEVVEFSPDDILDAPDMGTSVDPGYLLGIARKDGAFLMLLDPERLFSLEELAARAG